jgi:error-prone DNA polymerase
MSLPSYAPLWCKSNYSFLEGASHPEELVETASELGLRSIAITDRDGVYGLVRAHVRARDLDVHLIVGAQVTLDDGSHLVVLATNKTGYANMCRLLTKGRLRSPKGESSVTWYEVCKHAEGVIALWGGDGSLIASEADPVFVARDLCDAFGDRVYAVVTRHRDVNDSLREERVRTRAERYGLPLVGAVEVLYHTPARRDLQDVLTCLRHGVTLNTAGSLTRVNAEHALRSAHRMGQLFPDDPDAVALSVEIAARCTFSLDDIRYRYPSERLPSGRTTREHLDSITYMGAGERYGDDIPPDVQKQVDKELTLIHELDYDGYFLTMWEIVQYCRREGILCQGRGSAANSAVCYCLGITAVDPVRMGLLFERFLSRERNEPPDIDLDIEHQRREEVIQHVYDRYGRTHAAMVANFVRFRARSAVREVGKVLELPETALDRMSKLLGYTEGISNEALVNAGFDPESDVHQHLLMLTSEIQDFPRHLSIHPGGFLLGHEPVSNLVPIENATMEDRTVIQWDKEDLEDLGLFKVDLLGLGILTVMHESLQLLASHYDTRLTMATIPHDDPDTYAMIQKGDTVGVFQIESRAQMAMLPRLKPKTYYDLVIEVSIVRPGPITGGMVHPYLRRRNGEEEVTYPAPSLEPVLKKTLGVPLFQEQVMRLAVVAADYTPGEADQLRRDMAAWRRSGRLEAHRTRLIHRMQRNGIAREFAERVFEQIKGFGEYGFPESHAASFALIAYATSWLKCHHPDVFLCALLNAQPMGFYPPSTLIDDGRRHGVTVLPVNANVSEWNCTLERDTSGAVPRYAVRVGLRFIKGIHEADGERLLDARRLRSFRSIADLMARAGLNPGMRVRLAESGALEDFERERRNAVWEAQAGGVAPSDLPLETEEIEVTFDELTMFQQIGWDYLTTHHSTRGHPLEPLREQLNAMGLPDAARLNAMQHDARARYAGIVNTRQRPRTARGVTFMTLEDETGFVNVICWQKVWDEYKLIAKTTSFLGVTGTVQTSEGVTHLIAKELWRPKLGLDPAVKRSRDFR